MVGQERLQFTACFCQERKRGAIGLAGPFRPNGCDLKLCQRTSQRLRPAFLYAGEVPAPGNPQLKEFATAVRRLVVARSLRGSNAFIPLGVDLLKTLIQRYQLIVARQSGRKFANRESSVRR